MEKQISSKINILNWNIIGHKFVEKSTVFLFRAFSIPRFEK